jgi:hypothetical protein
MQRPTGASIDVHDSRIRLRKKVQIAMSYINLHWLTLKVQSMVER